MALTEKQITDLNNMNVAAQNVNLGDIIDGIVGGSTVSAKSSTKIGVAVPDATGEVVTKAEFNALLKSLRNAGIIAK